MQKQKEELFEVIAKLTLKMGLISIFSGGPEKGFGCITCLVVTSC